MHINPDALRALVEEAERLGVIGSPSSTSELSIDILGSAAARKLVGELAVFRYLQDSEAHYALGQITEVVLRNIWHEDPTMRSLVRQRGRVDAISGRQDTHLGRMAVSAVFRAGNAGRYEPGILGTIPATGTSLTIVTDEILRTLLLPYRDQVFFLGNVYGSLPKLPLWFKHFGTGTDGAGEAYHLGVFGRTGSGKSVLAKMILTAYARYRDMGILVIDPQGEFSRELKGRPGGEFRLPLKQVFRHLGKEHYVLTAQRLVLDRWELFEQLLYESEFFNMLTIRPGENRENACRLVVENLKKKSVRLHDIAERGSFDSAWHILSDQAIQTVIYRSEASRDRFRAALQGADQTEFYERYWRKIGLLFDESRTGAKKISSAVEYLLDNSKGTRPVIVIDLSSEETGEEYLWNDRIRNLVIKRILEELVRAAEGSYRGDRYLNTLVVVDEAHRLASRETQEDDDVMKRVKRTLRDAVRTTRKYGLGWMFVSQTLSSLDREIVQQLRIFFFGFGLSLGQEYQSVQELVGGARSSLDLYRLFRDPHSAFDPRARQYSFMTIGPVSPLSFSGFPLFFNAFNSVEAFLQANQLPGKPAS